MRSRGAEGRRSARTNVLLRATVEFEGVQVPVRVANLSAHGALLSGATLPKGAPVVFRCNDLVVPGTVAWVSVERLGISFSEPIPLGDILRQEEQERPAMGAIVKDTRKVDFRRPGFRGNQLSEEERRMLEEWKKEDE